MARVPVLRQATDDTRQEKFVSKFSDFLNSQQQQPEPPTGMDIDGSFMCQFCPEQVDEATYFAIEKILLWKCSQGHKSFAEDFSL